MDDIKMGRLRENRDFKELERTRGLLGWSLTLVMLVVYFGFVGMVAFAPALMGKPILGVMTLGFPLGLGVILIAIALTGFYVLRANDKFDALTKRITAAYR
jgi:uncharacterized membrane protein (DUF485 family)